MSHVQWWLCGLSFAMGLVLTLALTIHSGKPPAPVRKSTTPKPDEPPTTRIAPTEQRTTKVPVTEQRTTKIPIAPDGDGPASPENPRRG